jgi:methylenetetrahydrofolate dehydrogenase (NADP+)/methenyltetrahydrofolate cyclohydrolase
MILMDGNKVAALVREEIREQVQVHLAQGKRAPCLAAILVGTDGASETYVSHKVKDCAAVGFTSRLIRLPETCTEQELLALIETLNQDPELDGMIVQLPLPKSIREEKIVQAILPQKDVDGFHPQNIGLMARNFPAHLPATPAGILRLLKFYEIETSGKHAVVIGRSNIVGSPISILLARNSNPGNCTVTLCHSKTEDMTRYIQDADILVVAAGKKHLINVNMIKPGAVVIDVGIHRIESSETQSGYKLTGDVNPAGIEAVCSAFTPVPGGVGPMTRAMLLENTLNAYTQNIESRN